METDVLSRFSSFLEPLAPRGDRVLLTVSGGQDSMTMADLFLRAGIAVGIAHCNFGLRGADSLRDEAFVRAYAERAGVPCYVRGFDTRAYAEREGLSIQVAARDLRYGWFEEIRRAEGFDWIATAHHLNDHTETLLHHLFKGTGIRGLRGIPVKNGRIIRPLLFLTKEEILRYIAERGIIFVEDDSNQSLKYTRNFLRHRVIPLLEEAYPGLVRRLEGDIRRFEEAGLLYEQAVALHKKALLEPRGPEIWIPIRKLKKVSPLETITYELFREWGFRPEACPQIVSLLDGPPGKTVVSSTHRVIRDRTWLIVTPLEEPDPSILLIPPGTRRVVLEGAVLHLREVPREGYLIPGSPGIAAVDAALIHYPLAWRHWKQGDYFYPLGLGKKKKISRFFIDRKVPLHEKQKAWILLSGEHVVWVAGMRIDHRFRITPATTTVLELALERGERTAQP